MHHTQSMWTTAKAWGYVAHNLMEGVVLPDVKRVQLRGAKLGEGIITAQLVTVNKKDA